MKKRENNYELFKHRKFDIFRLFVQNKNKIIYYREYNNESESKKDMILHLHWLRADFSPIRMEWRDNLCDDIWTDVLSDYQYTSKEEDFMLVEDGEFKFYE